MRISIHSRILFPMIAAVLIGVGGVGMMGFQAVSGQAKIQELVQAAFEAKSRAADTHQALNIASAVVARVTAMTNFIPPDKIKSDFEAPNSVIAQKIEDIAKLSLGNEISQKVEAVRVAHAAWRSDANLILGLNAASEIPTEEKLNRSFQAALNEVEELNHLVDAVAVHEIDTANASLYDRITLMIELGGILALAFLVGLVMIGRSISGPILTLSRRMDLLAQGQTAEPVPYTARGDEIGKMASTVEIFRLNAIEKGRLEAEGSRVREEADIRREADRLEAEEHAQMRLSVATSGLAGGLRHLAAGNLAFRLEERFAPEFEALREDFNQSVDQLAKALTAVMHTAHVIDQGTLNIQTGMQELAGRTEQQATSLKDTAAALGDVTAQVKQASETAEDARQAASEANHAAVSSAIVVNKAVAAMGEIEGSSSQISNIISVIDQIAFQTNLLALNAGVEAARAGEAGKGFAVVAQEVRELAQRSAGAAKEIKALIARSSEKILAGVDLVNQTGAALNAISGHISRINDYMDAISSTGREQSTSLSQVNAAMHKMDQVTQHNATRVSEAETSTRLLAVETEQLRTLISEFRLASADLAAVSAQSLAAA
jgi:methyl-accepting chemotaxis protein